MNEEKLKKYKKKQKEQEQAVDLEYMETRPNKYPYKGQEEGLGQPLLLPGGSLMKTAGIHFWDEMDQLSEKAIDWVEEKSTRKYKKRQEEAKQRNLDNEYSDIKDKE